LLSDGRKFFLAVRVFAGTAGERGLSHLEFLLADGFFFRGLPMSAHGATVNDTFKFQKGETMLTPDADLVEMMNRAKKEKLLFQSIYDEDILLSVGDLEKAWEENRFRWGAVNWLLVEPKEIIR
jgi:hypothetical protein